jgi:hypothetical protein
VAGSSRLQCLKRVRRQFRLALSSPEDDPMTKHCKKQSLHYARSIALIFTTAEHGRAAVGPFYEAVSSEIFDAPDAAELTPATSDDTRRSTVRSLQRPIPSFPDRLFL